MSYVHQQDRFLLIKVGRQVDGIGQTNHHIKPSNGLDQLQQQPNRRNYQFFFFFLSENNIKTYLFS